MVGEDKKIKEGVDNFRTRSATVEETAIARLE